MSTILIVSGLAILLWGLLGVHRRFTIVILAVGAGLMITNSGINIVLGKARAENDKPVVLVSRGNCYRFKVLGFVSATCYETIDQARQAMLASQRYQRWKQQYGRHKTESLPEQPLPKLPPEPPHAETKHHAAEQGQLQHRFPEDVQSGALEQDGVGHFGVVEQR